LLDQALAHPVEGWDFSWLRGRLDEGALPWDYSQMVAELARTAPDLLDLGTGGGEWLAGLDPRPPRTCATESWPPNFRIARDRLRPLGVEVFPYQAPADNPEQLEPTAPLPFPNSSFHLISNRHEAFAARELARVLIPGGCFITEQVGGWEQLTSLLGAPMGTAPAGQWRLAMATAQLEAAGLEILGQGQARPITRCRDVGALVWYLRATPWVVPDFTVERYRARLQELHREAQRHPLEFGEERFWVLARLPSAELTESRARRPREVPAEP